VGQLLHLTKEGAYVEQRCLVTWRANWLTELAAHTQLLQNRGFSYRKMEQYEDAIRDYSMAVQVGAKLPHSELLRPA